MRSSVPFLLLAVIIVLLMTASIVEKVYGVALYSQWWFVTLWGVMAVSAAWVVLRLRLYRRPVLALFHCSLALVLVGALVTHLTGRQGSVVLQEGEPPSASIAMPFTLVFKHFHVAYYPGTTTPMDYVSEIEIMEEGRVADSLCVSMNHIGQYRGYRFYQSGYDADQQATCLMVSYDPWGIGITYTAYALLFVSMLLLLVLPQEGFRRLLRQKAAAAVLLSMLSSAGAYALPKTLPADVAAQFGNLYAYYNGRICPLQTVANDFTVKLYGSTTYQGLTAEQVLSGWLLFPSDWIEEPTANISDDEKQALLSMLFGQQLVRIYPYADGQQLRWLSQADQLPRDMPHDKWLFITKSLDYVGELAWQKDYAQLSIVLQKIRAYQQQEAGDVLPDACTFRAEKLYNRIGSTRPVAIMLIVTGLLSFFIYLSVWLRRHDAPPVWLRVVLTLILSIAVVYLLLVIILRGYVGGHLPLTNGYETMQFMALCILLFTLLARRFTLPFGLLLSGLAMLVSMMGEKHPPITSLTPVLSSPLLCLHVCTVMAAYALLSFTMLNGITALVLFRHAELQKKLAYVSRLLLYPAVFLLTTGIFLGAIWANQSWGRYWGWDQKEVWALITMLVYSVAFHRDSLRWLNKPLCFHLYLVMSFLTLLMTYFGVNFFLGGMHAYA